MQPLCRLVNPPFRMSWMCCTIRFIATEKKKNRGRENLLYVAVLSRYYLNLTKKNTWVRNMYSYC
uniref:Uncharacterized protein n=1 Tax=Hucho hucho TaxID=62062 RepID=A0A4W5L9N8_9TELE